MRVICTGALGVNGVWAMHSLLARGATVLATDVREDFSLAPDLAGQVEFAALDVTRGDDVRAVVAAFEPDAIVHLAALLPAQCQADPHLGYEVNLMGTAHVLRAARGLGVARVVLTSSKGAYGAVEAHHGHPDYVPLPEHARVAPVTVYDHAKLASEGLGINYAATGGPEFVALRFANIYGPGKLVRHGPMSLVSGLIENAWAGRPTRLERGGDERDDQLYVRDAGEAIALATLTPGPLPHALYNVGTGRGPTLAEVADAVRARVPDAEIEIGPGLDPMGVGIAYYSIFDVTRAERELGFAAAYDLDAGIADYLERLEAMR